MRRRPTIVLVLALAGAGLLAASDAGAARQTLTRDLMRKLNMVTAQGDPRKMAPILRMVEAFGPEDDYPEWAKIATRARVAAERGDIKAAKAACKDCHDKYRDDYKRKYGSGGGGGGDEEGKGPKPVPGT
jgi:hypothetical protein